MWMNEKLKTKGKKPITIEKLLAYVGLELAMSLVQIGSIKQYWEEKQQTLQRFQKWFAMSDEGIVHCSRGPKQTNKWMQKE